ncbi:MAG: hypothetical protein GX138_05510 [Firmicutes bacterium]|nr:hypothetical protein [Bacillota bacterium]
MKKLQKLLLLTLVLMLVLASCGPKVKPEPPIEDDRDIWPRTNSFSAAQLAKEIDDFDFNEVTKRPIFWSGMHTFALGFLGQIEGEEAKDFHKSKETLEYLAHLDIPDEVIILQVVPEPTEAWLIIPAPYSEKLVVYNEGPTFTLFTLIELLAKAAVIYTDSDAGFTVEAHFDEEGSFTYTPENSDYFLNEVRYSPEIYDVSPELILVDEAYVFEQTLFTGYWQGFSLIDHLDLSLLGLDFFPDDFIEDEMYFTLLAEHIDPEGRVESWEGYAFFDGYIDFAEEEDLTEERIHFELYRDMDRENWDAPNVGRFQLYSKFQYAFWHPNVLYLYHTSYDPFTLEEENFDYVLWRSYKPD